MLTKNSLGQSLIELITVITVAIIVIGAITFATIGSLRNAQFAKNQSQATKLAQEGLEKVKAGRNRDSAIVNYVQGTTINWSSSQLWDSRIESRCQNPCYFNLIAAEGLTNIAGGGEIPSNAEPVGEFKRIIVSWRLNQYLCQA